jgi:hypothetical protein
MVHRVHPSIVGQPGIATFFEMFEFDDARVAAAGAG